MESSASAAVSPQAPSCTDSVRVPILPQPSRRRNLKIRRLCSKLRH
ncbi:hypothetical protein KNP414_06168 [Paenibacillus mucilaginosus KNP414]|uniref:Uncharacterized protein n=1 Tax=Paenibacillus mucilaginosus (strain KNP414) TaxID=1036673 RepID=F8FIE8_PAEMK|nr:hypothetical protein KNP414_06168 [Paenibacillus mucilaginosus KNP414]